jgi:1-acyl-sn-glycerol-3-phosphate acyltransferase
MSALGRRLVTIPSYLLLFLFTLAALPVLLPLSLAIDLARGSPSAIARSLLFFTWYLGCELAGITASFALWCARLFRPGISRPRWLDWHYRLQAWWALSLMRGAQRCFDTRFEIKGDGELGRGPFILFIRHVSTADTLLVAVFLSARHGFRFRYVLKRALLWDPCLDIVGNRLPNHFVDRLSTHSTRAVSSVRNLAEGLGPDEGVLIYPEGTRFTEAKRARTIEKLEERDASLAGHARALQNVLPPRLGGSLALLGEVAGADAVFCALTGFEGIRSPAEFLGGGLVRKTVRVSFWKIPGSEVPQDREGQIDWLFAQWRRLDDWVGENQWTEAPRR